MGTKNGDLHSEMFRKELVDLIPATVIQGTVTQEMGGAQKSDMFIPRILKSDSMEAEIDVKSLKMMTSYDGMGVLTRRFEMTWHEKDTVEVTKSASGKKLEEGLKSGKIQCDGPCKKYCDVTEVIQFGCDHVICDQCRRSQNSATLFDGSPGCCHLDCVEKATFDGAKLQSGRRLDSMQSSVSIRSNEGPWEFLQIRVSVVKLWNNHVYRTLMDYEFPSQTRMAELMKTLEEYRDVIQSGRSYYSWQKPSKMENLHPISLMDTNVRFYHLLDYHPLVTGTLHILIIGEGIGLE